MKWGCKHILYPQNRIETDKRGYAIGKWETVYKCIKCAKILNGAEKHRILEAREFNVST